MRILVGWDNSESAELIGLYLNTDEHSAVVEQDRDALIRRATQDGPWDVVLLSTTFPDSDRAFDAFFDLHERLPGCPIVGACDSSNVVSIVRFLAAGMHTYLLRDAGGDFMFLVLATLESAVEAAQAERDQQIADKLRDEVEAVRKFQTAMIGDALHAPPGYSAAAMYEPSEIRVRGENPVVLAGGDFYDLFPIDRSRYGIVVSDAAGHGMQACLSVTILQTHLQMLQESKIRSAVELVQNLNQRFCAHRIVQRRGNLATVLCGILNIDRHELTWTSAGHPFPLLDDRSGDPPVSLGDRRDAGPPLGVDAEFRYREMTVKLPPGSRLILYSDGLTEASPDENSGLQYGLEGVGATLRRVAERNADDAVRALMNDSNAFTRGNGRHDDTSVLVLDRG